VLTQAVQTASSGGCGAGAGFHVDPPDDVVDDAWRRGNGGGRGSRKGKTERCLFKKISILIAAYCSTAGREISSLGYDCLSYWIPHPIVHSLRLSSGGRPSGTLSPARTSAGRRI
jgi:hypothetical protein